MILCDHCNKVIPRADHCIDQDQRDLHRMCLMHVNAARIIIDYVAICDRRGELLNFEDFVPLWITANEIAIEETLRLTGKPRDKEGESRS